MKGYKTAYTPHEVKKREEAAERRGVRIALETVYAACVLAMLDNGVETDKAQDIVGTANSILETMVFDKTRLAEILNTLKEEYNWEVNFYED